VELKILRNLHIKSIAIISLFTFSDLHIPGSGVRRIFPRGGPKHRLSQRRAEGAMPPLKFVENIVILCFERRFSKTKVLFA